ncbi:hypothetical protein BKA81DRAFT_361253 [Phyllosticta paracitricarpa]
MPWLSCKQTLSFICSISRGADLTCLSSPAQDLCEAPQIGTGAGQCVLVADWGSICGF